MDPLLELKEKLSALVKAHVALKEKYASIEKELHAEKEKNSDYLGQIADLKANLINNNLSGERFMDAGTRAEMKQYIDEVVKLIDASLAQL